MDPAVEKKIDDLQPYIPQLIKATDGIAANGNAEQKAVQEKLKTILSVLRKERKKYVFLF